jgi:hypothetical protein
MTPARIKDTWGSWRDKPYAANAGSEEKRKQSERWSALAEFIRKNNGWVTSTPNNRTLRIEVAKNLSAKLTDELTALGYAVMPRGSSTRIVGAAPSDPKTERMTRVTPSPFLEVCVLEIRTDGK